MSATTSSKHGAKRSPSKLGDVELNAWRGFLRSHSLLTRRLDAELVAAHSLPLSSYEVLLFLAAAPGGRLRMSDLADSVLLSRSGLTRLVDRLEREGFVNRQACPTDQRSLHAVITEAGHEQLAAARLTHFAGVRARFLDNFSEVELAQLADFWQRLGDTADGPAC